MVCCGQLQQGFATGEMGFNSHFAQQQERGGDVRFVPEADILAALRYDQ
jgi:hypothetical protein